MIVNAIKDLFEHGQYQAILDRLAQTGIQAQVAALSEPDQMELRYYQSRALTVFGDSKQGLHVATTVHTTLQATDKKSPLLLASLSAQLRALEFLGEIDDAYQLLTEGDTLLQNLTVDDQAPAAVWIPVFELTKGIVLLGRNNALAYASLSQALADFEKYETPSHLAETVLEIGKLFYGKGEHDTALEYHQRCLALYEKLEHNAGISSAFLQMGFLSYHKGETDTMAEYFRQSLTFAEASGLPRLIASALRYVGSIPVIKSEFDTAIRYYQRSLALAESIGHKNAMYDAFVALGGTYYLKGELDKAFDYYQRALTLVTILQDDAQRARTLSGLIRVTLARQDHVQAQTYLTDLQNVAARTPDNKHIQFRRRLMEALVSKQRPRMTDKVHAQMLLRQLVTEEYFGWRWNLAMESLLHLCDLSIYEARFTGEGTAWEEAKTLLQQFYTRAQDTKSTGLITEALLLQAKFAQIDGDLQQAQTHLTEAKTLATELNLGLFLGKVGAEQKRLATDFGKWQDMIRRNAPLQERLTEARLEEYLQKAQDVLAQM